MSLANDISFIEIEFGLFFVKFELRSFRNLYGLGNTFENTLQVLSYFLIKYYYFCKNLLTP
jgi:hypothetical protein